MNPPLRVSNSHLVVIDASVASAWILDDESDSFADDVYAILQANHGLVPQHWHFEIRNVLLKAERRERISPSTIGERLNRLSRLSIDTDQSPNLDSALELARRHLLTFYDALYLELALRHQISLATLDNALGRAASAESLPTLT